MPLIQAPTYLEKQTFHNPQTINGLQGMDGSGCSPWVPALVGAAALYIVPAFLDGLFGGIRQGVREGVAQHRRRYRR